MKKSILITDSLFIFDEHLNKLIKAGFAVERLDKPNATEEELIAAIKGKHGYILGGVERVTEKVVNAADCLEVISFTGSGYTEFIPAHELATKKGIAITTASGANAIDVAEFTLGLAFEMVKNFPLLRSPLGSGGKSFYTARRLRELTLGVVGFGRIGQQVAKLAHGLGMKVVYTNRTPKKFGGKFARKLSMAKLLAISDIVCIHVDKKNGNGVIGAKQLSLMKNGAILINAAFSHAVDADALHHELKNKRIKAAFDSPVEKDFGDVERGYFAQSNAQTAFNTKEANQETSDRVTTSIINILKKGRDRDVVNPSFRKR